MKKNFTLIILFCLAINSYGQSLINNQRVTQPPPPAIAAGCESAENRYKCGEEKLRDLAFKALQSIDVQEVLKNTQKDTIFMNTVVNFDTDKKIILEKSSLKFHESEMKPFNVSLSFSLEDVPFKLSSAYENPDASFSTYLFLKIDRTDKKLIPLYDYKPKRRPFSGPDMFAIYPGCESSETLQKQKKCFSASLNKHVGENFNTELGSNLDLHGTIRMFAAFTIDTEGNIIDIRVRAPHPALAREVERITKLLPSVRPASLEGIPVEIPYTLPIMFRVQ